MATPHISSALEDIAKTVLMPGDPLRAKIIAETFLEDYKQINSVRNMFGYTGNYKGKPITVFSSGMGNPSMGIYSYELFTEYGVEEIIRVGSCGSFREDLDLYEILLVENSYSLSSYLKELTGEDEKILPGNKELNEKLEAIAKQNKVSIQKGNVFCTDVFYNQVDMSDLREHYNCYATEMETFALFSNARKLNKKASAILTVTDNLVTNQRTTSEEREKSILKMVEIALESII